jgi:hypothetical protein
MTKYIDASAILSLIVGGCAFLFSAPVLLPIIGLGLGANAILKQRTSNRPSSALVYLGMIACFVNGIATVMALIARLSYAN